MFTKSVQVTIGTTVMLFGSIMTNCYMFYPTQTPTNIFSKADLFILFEFLQLRRKLFCDLTPH